MQTYYSLTGNSYSLNFVSVQSLICAVCCSCILGGLCSECSAKPKHERTDRKPDTPQPFLSSASDEIQTAGNSNMDVEERKKTNLTCVHTTK